jgi:aspartyl-tRNA(Asn)/glutamyl-tRNA(Gln) amidotransferase subunit A
MADLVERSLTEISGLIATRQVSATEVVSATLARIEETESSLHAYAAVLAEQAIDTARRLDDETARGHSRGPLHGIPIGVKDVIHVQGAATEGGSQILRDGPQAEDATVVRKLRNAGAVIIGKTVSHEFAWGVNDAATLNPWRPDCYPGGSSTGSGVAVGACSAFGAVGTDTGGSIRIPASINGIVGLKPTYGRVSCHGVIKVAPSLDHVGPLTRTVSDCAHLLQAMAGHDPYDNTTVNAPPDNYLAVMDDGVKGMTIGVERDHYFYEGVTSDVRQAVEDAIAYLEAQGASIIPVTFPEFSLMVPTLLGMLFPEASSYHHDLLRSHGEGYDPLTRIMASLGDFIPASHYVTALRARKVLCGLAERLFDTCGLDAMLWPTMPQTTAPKTELNQPDADGETPMNRYTHHTFTANVLGQPALSVPCGRSGDGLPIGFDLLGRPLGEAQLFRIAKTYENGHHWHTMRPPISVDPYPRQNPGLRG